MSCIGLASGSAAAQVKPVLYVDPDIGNDDFGGTSWQFPYKTLEQAITESRSAPAKVEQIWLKSGTYTASTPANPIQHYIWRIPLGVSLYGNFAGNETSISQRIFHDESGIPINQTILTADHDGDDDPADLTTFDDNVEEALIEVSTDQLAPGTSSRETTIDGIVFEGARNGGWITASTGAVCDPTKGPIIISRCLFRDSYPDYGHTLLHADGAVRIQSCEFAGNHLLSETPAGDLFTDLSTLVALYGCEDDDSASLANCTFYDNTATPVSIEGSVNDNPIVIQNSFFIANTPRYIGAIAHQDGPAGVVNCTFVENVATLEDPKNYPIAPNSYGVIGQPLYGLFYPIPTTDPIVVSNCVFSDCPDPVFSIQQGQTVDRTVRYSMSDVGGVGGGTQGPGWIAIENVQFTAPRGYEYTLAFNSPGIDSGDSTAFEDALVGPYDFYSAPRHFDNTFVVDTGIPSPNHPAPEGIADMGAVERICTYCAGDVNCDAKTDAEDFTIMAQNFGQGPGKTRGSGDLSGDGYVNAADFTIYATDFGCDEN